MNKLKLISKKFNIGENIKILQKSGDYVEGRILELDEDIIEINSKDGVLTLFESAIDGFQKSEETYEDDIDNPTGVDTGNGTPTEREEDEVVVEAELVAEDKVEEVNIEKTGGIKIIRTISEKELTINSRIEQYAAKKNIPVDILVTTLLDDGFEVSKKTIITNEIVDAILNNNVLDSVRQKLIKQAKEKEKEQQRKKEKPRRFSNLSDLGALKEEFTIEENKKVIPANGLITSYYEDNQFGTLLYEDKIYRYNFSKVQDEGLISKFDGNEGNTEIPIICLVNNTNSSAIFIHSPMTIESCLEKIELFIAANDTSLAKKLIKIALNCYPSNSSVLKYQEKLKRKKKKKKGVGIRRDMHSLAMEAKNVNQKIEHFTKSIESRSARASSSVMKLAELYISESKGEWAEKAIKLLLDNKKILKPISLIVLLTQAKDFLSSVKYSNIALEELKSITKKQKYYTKYQKHERGKLLLFKANACIMINNLDEAEKCLEIGRTLAEPGFVRYIENQLNKLRAGEKIADKDLETLFTYSDVETKSTHNIPKILKYQIENCQYEGLSETKIKQKKFTKADITQLEKSIEDENTPLRMKAERSITIIKLMQEIDLDETEKVNVVVGKASYNQALAGFTDYSHMDTVRTFALISLQKSHKAYKLRWVRFWLYTLSLFNNYELRSQIRKEKGSKRDINVLKGLFQEFNEQVYTNILYAIKTDKFYLSDFVDVMKKELSDKKLDLLNNEDSPNNIKSFFIKHKFLEKKEDLTIKKFEEILKEEAIRFEKDLQRLFTRYTTILKKDSPQDIYSALILSYKNDIDSNLLMEKDLDILKKLCENASGADIISDYLKEENYDEKERLYAQVEVYMDQLSEDITLYPTTFTFECILPIINKFGASIELAFNEFKESSSPDIHITLQNISRHDHDNVVRVEIHISNGDGCAPIRGFQFVIDTNNKDFKVISDPLHPDIIRGGSNEIISFDIRINEFTIKKGVFDLDFSYIFDDLEDRIEDNISLSVSKDEFVEIENPYAALANGKAVEDPAMFFGRDNFIKEIIKSITHETQTKAIAIYGQKRSGKSSVLHHLGKSLEEKGNCICASFSMGAAMGNPDSEFLWMLHKEIRDAYNENIKNENEHLEKIPFRDFSTPNFWDFMDDVKSKIKKNCPEKRLVVLLDEFTYIYSAIKSNKLDESFMKVWKSILEKSFFSCVLVGQDVMPSFQEEFKNELGMIDIERLSEISEKSAHELIVQPILDQNGKSRMLEGVPDLITDFTTCNPFYLIIFMDRLVKYMNEKKYDKCSKGIVNVIKQEMIDGYNKLSLQDFDGLINAGDDKFETSFKDEEVVRVLKEISIGTRIAPTISKNDLENNIGEDYNIKEVLQSLTIRGVIETKENKYKMKSGLFKDWLSKNY